MENDNMIDVDLARELIILKAKDLGMDDGGLDALDEVVCWKTLNEPALQASQTPLG